MEETQKTKEEIWAEIINGWEESGLAQRAYCLQKGLVLNTFHYWRKRLKRLQNQPAFVKVTTSKPLTKSKVYLFVKEGVRISFSQGTNVELIAGIIEAINNVV